MDRRRIFGLGHGGGLILGRIFASEHQQNGASTSSVAPCLRT
jgi:hypothetical protein